MGNTKEINIKNRSYYFFDDMIYLKDFDPNLLKIDKKPYKDINIYHIGYIIIKSFSDCENIRSVNPLYLMLAPTDGYAEENNGNRYLVIASTDKNSKVLIKYEKLWNEVKYLIKTINSGKVIEYGKDYKKIRFESDDNLPLGKVLNIPMCTITIGSVFEEDGKLYQQIYLDECLYQLKKCWNMIGLMFQKELMLIKQIYQENVIFVIIGIF